MDRLTLDSVVTAVQILLVVLALLVGIGVLSAVWIRRRRAGGVLIADSSLASHERRDKL